VCQDREIDRAKAQEFAESWLQAWNAHDLDRVLSHFSDDVVFTSPVAERLVQGSGGVICGKAALRDYWREGLRRIPDLRFELLDIYLGQTTLVINYRNQSGGLVNEVLTFDGDVVTAGHGTYLESDANLAGVRAALDEA
jgi:ketosteroid isomerase-like protein